MEQQELELLIVTFSGEFREIHVCVEAASEAFTNVLAFSFLIMPYLLLT